MFPTGGHLGLEPDLPDTILKGNHPMTIVAKLGFNWPSSFRGEEVSDTGSCEPLVKDCDTLDNVIIY
jgi:hypothetical protein